MPVFNGICPDMSAFGRTRHEQALLAPARRFPDPGFGPFTGEVLQLEINRKQAAIAFRSLRAQICVIAVAILTWGLALSLLWGQLAKYDRALALCAGL